MELEKTKASLDNTYEELKASESARADLVTSKLMMEQEIKVIALMLCSDKFTRFFELEYQGEHCVKRCV